MAVDELAGEGLPAEELEAGLGRASAAPRGAAAAMAGPGVGLVAAAAQPLGLLVWRPILNGDCSNHAVTKCSTGVLTNCAFGMVWLESN